jgi:HEAT repeat protein
MSAGRIIIVILAAIATSGCGHKPGPALSGGKPRDYWLKNVTSPDKKLRKEAVEKLGNLGAADAEVLPALRTALHDADAQIRGTAVIPELESLARNDLDAKVREYAAKAAEKLR